MKFLIFFLLIISSNLQAETITVCETCTYKIISKAIEIAQDGDIVLVKKGVYKETNIIVNKAITIKGENNPIIDGEGKQESIFAIVANDFTIAGFTLKNVGMSYIKEIAGVFIGQGKNFTIKECNFENVFYAFIIQKAKYGLIQDNKIYGNAVDETSSGNGIHIWKSKNIRIEGNTIESMRDGIYLEFVEKSSISNNRSINNIRYGLHFMFAHHNKFNNNEFKNNGAGVAVMFSKFIHMHHNTFHFNWGSASYGLLLKEINDATIENNYFDQNTIGINVDGCNRINYSNNHFVRNGWAIKFNGGCYNNIFEYNNFLHNSFDLSYNSKLNNNKFEANYWSEYTGYDLDKDGIGDVVYRPVKLFSYIVNQTPETLILLRSLFIDIINFSEKVSPVFTPDNLVDKKPIMRKIDDKF